MDFGAPQPIRDGAPSHRANHLPPYESDKICGSPMDCEQPLRANPWHRRVAKVL